MDKLEDIFEKQTYLDSYISDVRHMDVNRYTKSDWIQKKSLALIDEVTELLNEVNYKWWKNEKPIDESAVKEELVDVLHFFVSMCIDAGLTASELHEIYCKKHDENIARQQGRSAKPGYDPKD